VLREALKHAVRWQLLARNPVDAVEPPRKVQHEMRALSEEEVLPYRRSGSFYERARVDRVEDTRRRTAWPSWMASFTCKGT
jgi:hypothetical protein